MAVKTRDEPERKSRFQSRSGAAILSVLVFVLFLFGWWAVVCVLDLSKLILPTPWVVWESLIEHLVSGLLLKHLWITLVEILLGFGLGSVFGIALGALIAHSGFAKRVLNPYIVASQALPKLALAPIFIIWFGYGILSKVVITALICFFPLLENTITGLNEIEENKVELFRSLTANRWQMFYKLRVPHALPYIFTGLRVSIILSIVGAIVGEYVGSNQGLGALIIATQGNFDTPLMFSVFVILTLVGAALYKAMELLERVCFSWRRLKREG